MQTTDLKVLATLYPDNKHDSSFETLWDVIYDRNKPMIETLLLAPDIAFIALEMAGEIHTTQPAYTLDKMQFTQPITMVVVSIDGTEHRNPYGIRFTFDETAIDWSNFGGTTTQKQVNVPPMFHVSLDPRINGKDSRSVSLKPMYSLGEEEALQYVQDNVLDGLFYKVSLNSPQAQHISNTGQLTGSDIIIMGGFDCVATHKTTLLQLRQASQDAPAGSLATLTTYLTKKATQEIERVTKVASKFNEPMNRDGEKIKRFDLYFKQKGFTSAKLQDVPAHLHLFKKETPTATLYVSPLVAFQVDKQNNYVFAYNLFEESIQDAFKRLDGANQKLLAAIVLATDLRTN